MPLAAAFGLPMLLLLMALASSVCGALGFDGGTTTSTTDIATGDGGNGDAVEGRVYFGDGAVELPEGAVVEVQLLDTSLADAPAVTLSTQVYHDARRLPHAFRIPYDASVIDERRDYTLQARVTLDDRLLYTNDTVHPVLTRGAPADSDIEVIRVP